MKITKQEFFSSLEEIIQKNCNVDDTDAIRLIDIDTKPIEDFSNFYKYEKDYSDVTDVKSRTIAIIDNDEDCSVDELVERSKQVFDKLNILYVEDNKLFTKDNQVYYFIFGWISTK